MKRFASIILLVISALLVTVSVFSQSSNSPWPFFLEVTPRASTAGLYEFIVPLQVMDKAKEDLTDLRLYDAAGREIPYALRIRKEVDEKREIATRLFNRATIGNGVTEVSIDLGESPGEHNELEIQTAGANFRRRVDIEGSETGKDWRTLVTGETIFRFESQNKTVDSDRVNYPLSRYRYLRLRVHADEVIDKQAPDLTLVRAMMVAREAGLLNTWDATLAPYQLLRNQGAPASAWTIDLGAKVPCDRLLINIEDASFSRPFAVEIVDAPQNIRQVASGELTRHLDAGNQPLTITFDQEEFARKIRLLITDYSNPTLSISAIKAGAPARQLLFELKEPVTQPLRLFFGNARAAAPHYDFEQELAAKLISPPAQAGTGSVVSNPNYRREPLPFTERLPWLIYVVLTISSLALALILFSLARTTMRMEAMASENPAHEPNLD